MSILKIVAAATMLVCGLIGTAQADLVTLVAKGQVTNVPNYATGGGEAVDPKKIPFSIGDEIRVVFTFESLTPLLYFGACNGGSGIYYTRSLATTGIVSVADVSGVITSSPYTTSFIWDCAQGGIVDDRFRLVGTWNGPSISDSDGDLDELQFDIMYRTDPSCFTVPIALPTAALDPISCPSRADASLSVRWFTRVGGNFTQEVAAVTRGSFVIEEPNCADLARQLTADVFALNLRNGIGNNLDSKLGAAINASDDISGNHSWAATNQMYAFINSVEAQRGKTIGDGEADVLTATANMIITCLSP